MKLFGKKKEEKMENLVAQPLNYWEEKSYMMAITGDKEENVLDGIADRVSKIDGVQVLSEKLGEDGISGQIELQYDGENYEVGFYTCEFSMPFMLEEIERQQYFFTSEELNAISAADSALTIFMEFKEDSKKSFHLQIKLAVAMVPDMLALMDESAERMISARWARMAAESKVTPAAGDLYIVQGIQGEHGNVWLHTHGLCRCGLTELEIVESDKENYNNHYHVLTTLASMLIDKNGKDKEPYTYIGNLSEQLPLVVTHIPWTEGLKEYEKLDLGGVKDREGGHNTRTSLVFAYKSPQDAQEGILTKISDYDHQWGDNPLFFISNEETERMKALARERFHFVRELAENPENRILLKLGLIVDEEHREETNDTEHIWFELRSFEEEKFKAVLLQEPYYIAAMHQGDEGYYSLEDVTDWSVSTKDFRITPNTAYLLL